MPLRSSERLLRTGACVTGGEVGRASVPELSAALTGTAWTQTQPFLSSPSAPRPRPNTAPSHPAEQPHKVVPVASQARSARNLPFHSRAFITPRLSLHRIPRTWRHSRMRTRSIQTTTVSTQKNLLHSRSISRSRRRHRLSH